MLTLQDAWFYTTTVLQERIKNVVSVDVNGAFLCRKTLHKKE